MKIILLLASSLVLVKLSEDKTESSYCAYRMSIFRKTQSGICQATNVSEAEAEEGCQRKWNCTDLQTALITITSLDLNSTSPVNCVTISISPGLHLITAPVHLGSANVQLVGLGQGSDMTTVQCNYTVDVDETRIFDPEYSYVDYTVYLNRSEFFEMDSLVVVGCAYPFRLDTVQIVSVRTSIFM